ncbi:hypothetical protein AB6A40_008558 [Gnathostoma spinigerum]|uniref:Dihydropteridine reductase n=1 Tax=Gnathostoma spinigerum TaxID=75299 RepID=A0ABD6EUJ0_9BILA
MAGGRVIIYGGKGALGSALVDYFKKNGFWTLSIDHHDNKEADASIIIPHSEQWVEEETRVLEMVSEQVKVPVDAVLCSAGGWVGGNAGNKSMIKGADAMWKSSVWSSSIASKVAVSHLKEGGVLMLCGAAPAVDGTPGMIGYGMAKAAVHQLTRSLGCENSGMPRGSTTIAILPTTLDTPNNRKWMPSADFSKWTSLDYIASLAHEWIVKPSTRPASGSLMKLVTSDNKTIQEIL